MTGASLVRVAGLRRSYGDVHAVRGVSFELHRGEVLGFLGPNGAGKTTTLQVIAGALAPGEGIIEIAGIDLLDSPREAKRRIGYLPEVPPLHRELTVDEFLRHCARLRGLARGAAGAAVDEAKARCGLGASGGRLIGNLSKGYQQRVGIAQAILHRPDVVILDEPTVGLDPNQIRDIRALVRELGADHGVLLSTHILSEAQSVCDRVQIIHEGELVLEERTAALAAGAAAVRVVLARPPSPAAIAALEGVARVDDEGGGAYLVHHAGDAATPERLAEAAVRGGWGLRELTPARASLEEVFVALTVGDAPPRADEAPAP